MNHYHINQSPLYKLKNHKKLANYLGLELETLLRIISRGEKNYFFSSIDQEDGSKRELEVPKQQLMRIHRKLQKFFSKIVKPDYLYSGVKKKSNVQNGQYHIDSTYVQKTDIKAFYQSTSLERVKKCFLTVFKTSHDIAESLTELCCVRGHIPTGSPLSQSLSFFSNLKLFNEIEKFCSARDIVFSLYVDDLTFSRKEKFEKGFLKRIKTIFSKNADYELHKFREYNAETPKPITGVVLIGNKLFVPNKQRFKIKNALDRKDHILSKIDTEPKLVEQFFQSLIGRLYSASQISPKYRLMAKEIVEERRELGVGVANKRKTKKKAAA